VSPGDDGDDGGGGGGGGEGEARDGEREPVNILLVDDRPGNLLSLKGVLERPEYRLHLAQSGEEALRLILQHEFALIMLDVAMPKMDGFEVAAIVKQRSRFRTIPIIFVTASIQHIEWIFRAYSIGAVDFLQKPLDPHAVRAKVAVFVELFRQRQQLARQAERLRESERREREHEMLRVRLENERRYRNLAEAIPQVVWTADARGDAEYFNRRWEATTGMAAGASLGRGFREALHSDDAGPFEERFTRAIAAGSPLEIECRLRQADGGYRWYLCRALPERIDGDEVTRWLGTFTDIDEQKAAHQALHEAVQLRDEFLSVASHELRTPLTALQLHVDVMQRMIERAPFAAGGEGQRLGRKLAMVTKQVERLETLVANLLDVSRIGDGRLVLEQEAFALDQLAAEVVERFRDEADQAGCELQFVAPGPVRGAWDRLRIEQVITNLIANGLKYARGKPIDITVGERDGEAFVAVRDRGIGIAREDLERIFERFERAAPARNFGGLGLGLYIVRQIVAAHGGHVTVGSTPGSGSTFTAWLPLGERPGAEPEERTDPPGDRQGAEGEPAAPG
jgi:PAS domain S-box-containing protein